MCSTSRYIVVAGLLLTGAGASMAQHHDDLRSGKLRPTVGNISNEVAVARLKAGGVENPSVVRREQGKVIVRGTLQGKQTEIEFNTTNGRAIEAGPTRRLLLGPHGSLERPFVKGKQVPGDHRIIANPALMKGVVAPKK
jgi:hypothetical protein